MSRRAVAKGLAWSVPAVVTARAAPALAASSEPPAGVAGAGCKLSGSSCAGVFVKGYVFEVTLTNTTGETIFLYNQPGFVITITENNASIDLVFQAAVDATTGQVIRFPYEMPSGSSLTILLNAGENGTSADQPIAGSIFFPWGTRRPHQTQTITCPSRSPSTTSARRRSTAPDAHSPNRPRAAPSSKSETPGFDVMETDEWDGLQGTLDLSP